MAIKGYGLHFELLKAGSPYGATGTDTEWTMGTEVTLYTYLPTLTAGGVIDTGTAAKNTSNSTPTITNDEYGQAYFASIPAGRYTLLLDLQDNNNWRYFPGHRDVCVGFPETVTLRVTGDGTAGAFNLTIPGGDGINSTAKPFQDDIQVFYMGRTLMHKTQDYTLATADWPWGASDNTITIVSTPLPRGDSTILRTTEYLDIVIRYLPGGGY